MHTAMTFFVVGIGASEGGLEAVTELLSALPATTGMAVVLAQHLDPAHESVLSEILAIRTIPVSVARAGEAVQPGHVYVIPADAILTVHDGHIDLKRRTNTGERPSPVDVLFKSLAVAYASRAVGVVLSGGDSDGSLGIREIKQAGGFTFAQRPDSARFSNMPRHAIETGFVDYILSPDEIAHELVRLSRECQAGDSISGSKSKRRLDVEAGAHALADIIIDAVRAPLAVLDAELRILRVNPALSRDLDVRREEVEGRLLEEVPDGRWNTPELRRRLVEVLRDAQPMEDWEVTVDLAHRGRRVVSLSARRIPGDAFRAELLLLAFDDVTARARMTAALVANTERKDDFLAMLGHELRHPLTPIAHAVHLLLRGNPDPTTVALLTTIDTQTQRLLRFVNELLDVTRIGRGLVEIRRERLDFVELVREALQAIEPLIEQRRHVLTTALPAAPVYVNGDPDRLNQVVNNLLENAAKHTDPGGQITVTLEKNDDEVVLRVRDSGIGIAPENLERIFEPFTQSQSARAGVSSGLGLGLSVARRMMELHGGRIEAISAGLAMGSEFVASLPVLANEDDHPKSERPMGDLPPLLTVRTRRVLIVDDHEEVGQSLAGLVRRWGHEVALVKDGPSALSLVETFQPECAILDLSLPGMNGIVLARRLRSLFPRGLYMIALTGYAGAEIRAACLAAGFDEHLVKPGDIDMLEKLLGGESPGH